MLSYNIYTDLFKPLFDRTLAVILLLFFSPLFFLIILVLFFTNKGDVFFTQTRVGYKLKLFKIYKFKTMSDEVTSTDLQRLTKVGKFLRNTSLDELPQLFNMLVGDMSLVGPRPLLEQYIPLYSINQNKRHNVKPGITGLAQVKGRNILSWKNSLKYDSFYAQNISLLLDLIIIFKTFKAVFQTKNINVSNQLSRDFFNGEN